jgi:hypothetical protein
VNGLPERGYSIPDGWMNQYTARMIATGADELIVGMTEGHLRIIADVRIERVRRRAARVRNHGGLVAEEARGHSLRVLAVVEGRVVSRGADRLRHASLSAGCPPRLPTIDGGGVRGCLALFRALAEVS